MRLGVWRGREGRAYGAGCGSNRPGRGPSARVGGGQKAGTEGTVVAVNVAGGVMGETVGRRGEMGVEVGLGTTVRLATMVIR